MLAVRGGHAKTAQVLIEAGANVNLRNQVYRYVFLIPQTDRALKILPYS